MKKSRFFAPLALAIFTALSANATKTVEFLGTTYELDTVFHAKVGPGTTQTQLQLDGPSSSMQVFYLTIDKTTPGVELRAVCATDMVAGTETCTKMATSKSVNGTLYFCGTNGDFYTTSGNANNGTSRAGTPTASCTVDREIYKTSNSNYQFVVDTEGVARIGRLDYYTGTATLGEKVTLFKGVNVSSPNNGITIYTPRYWGTTNQDSYAGACYEVTAKIVDDDIFYAGGSFRLEVTSTPTDDGDTKIPSDGFVIHGRGTSTSGCNTSALDFVSALQPGDIVAFDNIVLLNDERIYPAQIVSGNPKTVGDGEILDTEGERDDASALHPRTGIGVSESGDSIIMMVIDGRTTSSAGARTSMLGEVLRYAGAYEGLNLDGGGSSTLYTSALGVRNHCSDGGERAVGNGIFASVSVPDDDVITEICFSDMRKTAPQYVYYTPVLFGYNQYGVMVTSDLQGFTLSCPDELGEIINDGTTLFATGSGSHLLTATYNGVTATMPFTIDELETAELKYTDVLIDNNRTWTVEVQALVDNEYLPVSPEKVSWTNSDTSVATIDDTGLVTGLQDGTTEITGTLSDVIGTLNLTVECPTANVMPIDVVQDVDAWTVKGSNTKNCVITPLDNGFGVDFTISSARGPMVTLSNAIDVWSLPDALQIRINPGDVSITRVTLSALAANGSSVVYSYFTEIESGVENVLTLPISDIGDVDDIGIYPIQFRSLAFEPTGSTNVEYHVDIPGIEAVYNNYTSGIETVEVDGSENTFDFNNPDAVYTVYSISGMMMAKSKGGIDTNNLVAGIYVVTSVAGADINVTRIVVK